MSQIININTFMNKLNKKVCIGREGLHILYYDLEISQKKKQLFSPTTFVCSQKRAVLYEFLPDIDKTPAGLLKLFTSNMQLKEAISDFQRYLAGGVYAPSFRIQQVNLLRRRVSCLSKEFRGHVLFQSTNTYIVELLACFCLNSL